MVVGCLKVEMVAIMMEVDVEVVELICTNFERKVEEEQIKN